MEVFLADLVQAQRAQGVRNDIHVADLALGQPLSHRATPSRRYGGMLRLTSISHATTGLVGATRLGRHVPGPLAMAEKQSTDIRMDSKAIYRMGETN